MGKQKSLTSKSCKVKIKASKITDVLGWGGVEGIPA
jgi:hypothetical protein